jgi:hypothetical protein
MEKEPRVNTPDKPKNLEQELRDKSWIIRKLHLPGGGPVQCEGCTKEGNFGFHDDVWGIGGEHYCDGHKESALDVLRRIDEKAERRRLMSDEDGRKLAREASAAAHTKMEDFALRAVDMKVFQDVVQQAKDKIGALRAVRAILSEHFPEILNLHQSLGSSFNELQIAKHVVDLLYEENSPQRGAH